MDVAARCCGGCRRGRLLLVVLAVLDHGIGWEMSGRVWHGVLVAALDRGWKVEVAMAGNGVAWGVAGGA